MEFTAEAAKALTDISRIENEEKENKDYDIVRRFVMGEFRDNALKSITALIKNTCKVGENEIVLHFEKRKSESPHILCLFSTELEWEQRSVTVYIGCDVLMEHRPAAHIARDKERNELMAQLASMITSQLEHAGYNVKRTYYSWNETENQEFHYIISW